ncbi:hypothetical protein D0Y65_020844 [Glycine soja]|uniref:Uncharacterized protein n=1 Tax=Glycine soja TaxID=3848 RepID=A0A445JG13_GLYSO|nr:hypothetical protein D0Y65_020844 [Glycine soja]
MADEVVLLDTWASMFGMRCNTLMRSGMTTKLQSYPLTLTRDSMLIKETTQFRVCLHRICIQSNQLASQSFHTPALAFLLWKMWVQELKIPLIPFVYDNLVGLHIA